MKKQGVMSKWLFFYEQRDSHAQIAWVAFVSCALATLCVFAGLAGVQSVIDSAAAVEVNQTGAPFFVGKYSLSQMYVLEIEGVKYQLCIALALIIRWFGLWSYRHGIVSAERKWVAIAIAEICLVLAVVIFVWYGWVSHRVLRIETLCPGCMPSTKHLLGATFPWD
jgi:Zinc-ribbon containing domain